MIEPTNTDIDVLSQLKATPELFAAIDAHTSDEFRLQNQLRKQFPHELVRLALTLHDLRLRAADKFSHAPRMWFDRQRFEQATSEPIARHKAARFREHLGADEVLDLCCGIGGDAIAMAEYGPVLGVDLDRMATTMAAWNCDVYDVGHNFTSREANVETVDFHNRLIHIDPDRRGSSGKRNRRLEDYQPNLEFLQMLTQRARGGAIKVGPASNFGGKFPGAEIELISLNGECKEAVVWSGELAGNTETRATVLPENATITGDPLAAYVDIGKPQSYVYDPDPALVRAGLIDVVAEEQGLSRLDDAEEYLTGGDAVVSPFLQTFRVVECIPYQQKAIRQYFRKSNFGQLEIKCRHLRIDVEKMRKQLTLPGDQAGVLMMAKNQGKTLAIICQRVLP